MILQQNLKEIFQGLTLNERALLKGRSVFITGFAGSLGFMLSKFFEVYGEELGIKKVYCLDNYIFGKPVWVEELCKHPLFRIAHQDVITQDFSFAHDADLIFHMASLASPVFYRRFPIETMDADVVGLRRLLDFYADKNIYNLLFYSTSEIYGDPDPCSVPTSEDYWGNVNTSGPRACYDESKRFGETLCYNFHYEKSFPVTVIRPFNSYGPGLRINDQRVVADFALNILNNEDIAIYSDGKATRTFCYITDTTVASLKCALYGKYDIFNIGNDNDEMTILELAKLYQKIGVKFFGYSGDIVYKTHSDKHYTTDNPKRRCPNIQKIKNILGVEPKINIEDGIYMYLQYLSEEKDKN